MPGYQPLLARRYDHPPDQPVMPDELMPERGRDMGGDQHDEDRLAEATAMVRDAIRISAEPVDAPPLILDIVH